MYRETDSLSKMYRPNLSPAIPMQGIGTLSIGIQRGMPARRQRYGVAAFE